MRVVSVTILRKRVRCLQWGCWTGARGSHCSRAALVRHPSPPSPACLLACLLTFLCVTLCIRKRLVARTDSPDLFLSCWLLWIAGDADAQDCLHHFVSDGDIWNARTQTFDMDPSKTPCFDSQPAPEGSDCVFTPALGAAQDYRRIAKQTSGAPVGTIVENFHTAATGEVVAVTFTTTLDTEAWCDAAGTVVSFPWPCLTYQRSIDSTSSLPVFSSPCRVCSATDFIPRVFLSSLLDVLGLNCNCRSRSPTSV